jgi:regulator of sigma E protease
VYLAGATFNVLLAIALATVVFRMYGVDEIANPTAYPVVADILPGSPAQAAGIRVGDKVLSIAGRDALDAQTLTEEIIMSPGVEKRVVVEREGQKIPIDLPTGRDERYHLGSPGWHLLRQGTGPPIIKTVMSGTPAETAGLKKGDKVTGLDDRSDLDEAEVRAMLAESPGRELTLHVERAGQTLRIPVTPRNDGGKGRIGVEFVNSALVNRKVSLGQAFVESLRYNWDASRGLLKALKSVGGRLS